MQIRSDHGPEGRTTRNANGWQAWVGNSDCMKPKTHRDFAVSRATNKLCLRRRRILCAIQNNKKCQMERGRRTEQIGLEQARARAILEMLDFRCVCREKGNRKFSLVETIPNMTQASTLFENSQWHERAQVQQHPCSGIEFWEARAGNQ